MPAATPLPRSPSILTLYNAEDLLIAPGCPVCNYAAEASDRYLTWIALEGHAEMGTITRLCAGLGACAEHTRRLAGQPGSAIRLTAMYRYIVIAARDRLTGRAPRLVACLVCEHDSAAAGRALETLLEGLRESVVRDRYRDLGGLCLPHLNTATAIAGHRDIAWLASTTDQKITLGRSPDWLAGIDPDAENRAALRRTLPTTGALLPLACPSCLAGAQAERDALQRLPGLAGDLSGLPGILCAGHLVDAAATASPRALRALLAWQAHCMASRMRTESGHRILRRLRRGVPGSHCLVCRARLGAAQRTLSALRGDAQAHRTSLRLCVRHLLALRARDQRSGRALSHPAVERADQLIAELTYEFERITQARSRSAPFPDIRVWPRAAAFIDGSVFGGTPPSEP